MFFFERKKWCFFTWKAYQTLPSCQNCPSDQPAKSGKYYQQKNTSLFPSSANTIIRALVYWGIPSYLRFRPEQAQRLTVALRPCYYR